MKKNDAPYDIFISYRRDNGWDTAKHLRDILTAKGYSVFFDVDSLRSGDFNRALLDVIKDCTDFIIILSPNALDRCVNEGDWVRQELACALEAGKNVIPVASGKFHFPETLPEDINNVRWKNCVEVNITYFDAMVEKLISFLHSKPRKKSILRWLLPVALVCVAAIAAVFFLQARGKPPVVQNTQPEAVQEETAAIPASESVPDALPAGTATDQAEEQPAPAETDSVTPKASAVPEKKDTAVESAWTGGNVLMAQIISMEEAFSAKDLPAFGGEITRKEIGSVSFLDTLENKPDSAWDVSENQDGSVMAWAVPDGELYHLYLAGEGGVSAPEDCNFLFCGYTEAETFEFGNAFHTDSADKMNRMFFNDVSIGVLDLSGFRTENVTQMISMFDGCISLRALDLSSFDTSNVANMLSMFDDCRSLIKLDLSGFDTAKVKYMDYMFKNCRTLKELDVSMFDISRAESLSSMFQDCAHLKSLHLGRFDTALFPHTTDLFSGCDELADVYYGGTETDWEDAGLGETLPESTQVHFGV